MYNNPFKIVIVFVAVSLIGLAVIPRLSIDLTPSYDLPQLTISYRLPHSSPEIVEQEATAPLENVLSQLTEVKKLYSVSKYNSGEIEITFDKHTDIAYKKFEVASLIRQTYPKLNKNLSYPLIHQRARETDNKSPLLIYRLNGTATAYAIHQMAEKEIGSSLGQLKGVESIVINGAEPLQITIQYDIDKLNAYEITKGSIISTLSQQFSISHPGMYENEAGQKLFIKMGEQLFDLDQLENIIMNRNGVLLKDIAQVYMEESEPARYFRIDGKNSVTLAIYGREGENKLVLGSTLKKKVESIKQRLPQGYELFLDYDDTEYLEKELGKIYQRSGLSVLILIIFIFVINRNLRYLIVLFSGILINLTLTSLCAWWLHINIHLYTIAGVTISFGLIVDNAIVMIDHIHKKKNTKIFTALFAASFTTIAALLLIYFLPEEEKQNLLEFAQIIALGLGISLIVAILYTPAVYQLLLSQSTKNTNASLSMRKVKKKLIFFTAYLRTILLITRYRKTFTILIIFAFGLPLFMLPSRWEGQEWYNKTIGSDIYQEEIRPITDPIFGGTLRLFIRGVFEKSSYRKPEKTQLHISSQLPYGNTVHQMNNVLKAVEEYLATVEGIDKYVTQVYSGQYGSIVIIFEEKYEMGSLPYQLKSRLIARSLDWGGVDWRVYGVGRGFNNSSGDRLPSFRVKMKGYNYDELESQANVMANKLTSHERIQEVNTNERLSWREKSAHEYNLHFDRTKMNLAGVDFPEVTQSISDLSKPVNALWYTTINHKTYPVFFKEKSGGEYNAYDLLNRTNQQRNRAFKLNDFSSLTFQKTANAIHKENRQYIRVLGFDYYGSQKFGNEYLDKVLGEMEAEMPIGYIAEKTTWQWNWEKTKRQYGLLLILILVIFFICSILFENLKQPLYIIVSIPISFIGLFLIFSVFDFYFDQGGYAAFIMLGGLVVNAAIFVINDLNNYRQGCYNKNIIKSVFGKAQPILLTILSTCFGLVPFVIGGQDEVFWFSLAIGTIGGLLFSMFAVFICLPVFLINKL